MRRSRDRLQRHLHGQVEEHGVEAAEDEEAEKDRSDAGSKSLYDGHRVFHVACLCWGNDVLSCLMFEDEQTLSRLGGDWESANE